MHSVGARYDRISRYYDTAYGWALARGSRVLVELRPLGADERVLEVGAGTGFALPHYPPGSRVTAVDLTPAMLEVAARKRLPRSRAAVDLVTMDAHDLGFADHVFDVVLFPHSLGVMDDPPRVIAEVARVTRADAELRILHTFEWSLPVLRQIEGALYDAFEHRLGWGRPLKREQTVAWCRKAGFDLVGQHRLGWKTILLFRKSF